MVWNYTQLLSGSVYRIISHFIWIFIFHRASQNPTPITTAKIIRPTRIVLDFYKKYSDCNIIVIINTITPIISVPLVPVIAIVTLDVQDLDHILQSSFR
jgi:hypothetical protein